MTINDLGGGEIKKKKSEIILQDKKKLRGLTEEINSLYVKYVTIFI